MIFTDWLDHRRDYKSSRDLVRLYKLWILET